jgi:putative polyketide hydroxylase
VAQIAAATLRGASAENDPATVVAASRRYGNHLGVEFGAAYDSAAVIPDGTEAPSPDDPYSDYIPVARPGHRAPHIALGRWGDVSTIDLVAGAGFTVLAGPAGSAWIEAATRAGKESSVPIGCYVVGSPSLEDPTASFCKRYGISEDGAVLVRPDGYVAFRAASCPPSPAEVLNEALLRVLHRS